MDFDTLFYDDTILLEVFQKNSTAKVNKIGDADINLREVQDLSGSEGALFPVTVMKAAFVVGEVFLSFKYKPIDEALLRPKWSTNLKEASQLDDKFEFFNEQLKNDFKDDCQFGYLSIELARLNIPLMGQNLKDIDEVED